ncbi:MAG: D-alanine--D-alanine ligase [Propionibacteriaceae bacterium]|nr:D-alanine--D-alanine ligase [Propionibacteriaceae bacterium]
MGQAVPVVFFFGGQSSEHEISCLTAAGILGALDRTRYQPYGIGIAKDGTWVRYDADDLARLVAGDGTTMPTVDASRPRAVLGRDGDRVWLATRVDDRLVDEVDVQVGFPVLHGPFGEDGTIQGLLEMRGLRYVGAGVAASAIGMDKRLTKMAFAAAGLPSAPWVAASRNEDAATVAARVAQAHLAYPLYVKPARGGSSVGVCRVEDEAGLAQALDDAGRWDSRILVEQGVLGGREIECAVLGPAPGSQEVRVTRPGEIIVRTDDAFYDYEAKYLAPDEADLEVPAVLDPDIEARVQDLARRAFTAIGAEGLSRVDSFVLPDGTISIIEINTMPGFTPISMFPKLWQDQGMSYADLISDLIEQALRRPLTLR